MIKQSTIDQIMDTAVIEEVIGEFVHLKRAGSNFKGLSPFVNEKTPSFFVSPSKQIFKDFSSGKGGNAISFLMDHEQYTYPEALRFLAKKYNIEIEEEGLTDEVLEERSERESLMIVAQFAETFFKETMWESDEGKSIGLGYFRERGFTDESIEKFKLGYSPDSWDTFYNKALEKGYQEEYLELTGLIKKSSKGTFYDGYRGRVIFPIHNLSGKSIGFGGRTLRSDKNIPKYVNSPESPIYHKSNVLYGLYQAKGSIVKNDNCFLVEGYTDVVQLSQSGVENVVSSSGTSLTEGQIRLIKRYTSNVTLLYDGDPAGIKASFRGIDMLLKEGLQVRVVLFPENEDPDSYAKKVSTEELQAFLKEQSSDFMTFKTNLLLGETEGDPIKKAALVHQIVDSIAVIPDHISQSIYIKECSSLLDIDEQALLDELNKTKRKNYKEQLKNKKRDEASYTPPSSSIVPLSTQQQEILDASPKITDYPLYFQEKDIIRLLLNYGEEAMLIEAENENGDIEEIQTPLSHYLLAEIVADSISFKHPIFQRIVSEYLKSIQDNGTISAHYFINHKDEDIRLSTADLLAQPYQLHNWEGQKIYVIPEIEKLTKAARGALYAYKTRLLSHLIESNQKEMQEAHLEKEDITDHLQKQIMLDQIKTQLASAQGITIIK